MSLIRNWIYDELEKSSYDKKAIYDSYNRFLKETASSMELDSFKRTVRLCYENVKSIDVQDYDDESVLRTEAQKQKLQDVNNSLRKSNRENYRIYNVLEEIYKENVELLKSVDLTKFKIKEHKFPNKNRIGILQLSDIHANEMIVPSESNNNSYDFEILSKRMKKYISKAIEVFKFNKVTNVHIFMTGDFINSSRRLGEKLAQCTSLVRASLLLTYILQQAIIELSKYFNITISSIVGNESRISEEYESSDIQLSENFDYLIFNNLKMIFNGTSIKFNESINNSQCVVRLENGFNALLLHGNQFKTSNVEKEIAKFLQSYVYSGVHINGVFCGHYHSSAIGDFISRSSSMCGANGYSTNDLGFLSRASQNIYIVNEDLGYDGYKIDLQKVNDVVGYDIIDKLEFYNVKSVPYNNRVIVENLV